MAVSERGTRSPLAALTLGAIGVVYGDIGTSVLYAVKEVFGSGHVALTPENIYGILSIFFWTLTVIVSLKYVTLILRADNNGEGGLVAMLALGLSGCARPPAPAPRHARDRHLRHLPLLRRRRHHAGDLGALGDGGPGGDLAGASPLRDPPDPGRSLRALRRAEARAPPASADSSGRSRSPGSSRSRCSVSRRSPPTRASSGR